MQLEAERARRGFRDVEVSTERAPARVVLPMGVGKSAARSTALS